jgi:hypothetical protein
LLFQAVPPGIPPDIPIGIPSFRLHRWLSIRFRLLLTFLEGARETLSCWLPAR